jgi:hypothetical protein
MVALVSCGGGGGREAEEAPASTTAEVVAATITTTAAVAATTEPAPPIGVGFAPRAAQDQTVVAYVVDWRVKRQGDRPAALGNGAATGR